MCSDLSPPLSRPDGDDSEVFAVSAEAHPNEVDHPRPPRLDFSPNTQAFYALFEGALDAIVVTDDEWRYVAVNPAACELFGLPQEKMLGCTIADFTPAGTNVQEAWQEFQQRGVDRGEFTIQRADGALRVVDYAATAHFLPHFHLSVLRDVTAQKVAEQALHGLNQSLESQVIERTAALAQANADLQALNQQLEENRKKYQTLFNVLPVGVSIINAEGEVVEVNPAAAEMFQIAAEDIAAGDGVTQDGVTQDGVTQDGVTQDGVTQDGVAQNGEGIASMAPRAVALDLPIAGDTGWRVIQPDGQPMRPENDASTLALRQGQIVRGQEQGIQHPDGTLQWLTVSAAPIPLEDYGATLAYLDVTARKQVELALQESEERLRMALDAAQMGIWDWNLETGEIVWSESMERIMGLEPGSFDGQFSTLEALIYPPDLAKMQEAIRRNLDHREAYAVEIRHVWPDGTVRWMIGQGHAVYDAQGKARRMLGTAVDITDRKQAELALQVKEQEFRTLAENSPDCIMRLDRQFRFLYVNPAVVSFTQIPAATFLGKTDRELGFAEETVARWQGALEQAFCSGQEQLMEYSLILPAGERFFDSRIVPEFSPDGTILSCLIVVRDITKLKQAQSALMQKAEREYALRLITQEIRASLDLNDILSTAVQAVHRTLQADRTLIFQLKTDQSAQVIQERVQPPYPSTLGWFQWDEHFPSECYASYAQGHARIVPDVMVDAWGECLTDYMAQMAVRSKMVVPILQRRDNGENRVWGLLITHACAVQRRWQAEELDLLQQVAEQLAIAIQQSELYQKLQAANRELDRLSNTDGLTQIANRRCFDTTLVQVWQQAQRSQQPLSLILCDVDYFKPYNDTYGHPAGDTCLAAVAQALKSGLNRTTDVLARYGGEEFAIILPCTPASGAIALIKAMQQAIADLNIPHSGHLSSPQVTLSFGLATTIPQPHQPLQTLLDQADQALYQAKQQGRNGFCVVPPFP